MPEYLKDLLGRTASEIRELNYPRLHSKDQIGETQVLTRDVRVNAGLTTTAEELDMIEAELDVKQAEIFKKFGYKSGNNQE